MNVKELILDGGDTLNGYARKLRFNDTPSGQCVTVSTPASGIVAVLDRHQQHMLMLFLKERLAR